MFFAAVIGLVLLVLQPYPILHDYPEWVYQGHVVWSLFFDATSAASQSFASMYKLLAVPVPNAISQAAIALLNLVTSPVMAGKIWLALYIVLALTVAVSGTKHHQLSGAKQLIFLIIIAFGPGFFNGYLNFQFGVLFFALFVVTQSQRSVVRLLLFSVVIYFSHATVFAAFVIYVIIFELFGQRRLSVYLALVPTLLMLLWYAAVKIPGEGNLNVSVGSLAQWGQYKIYTLAKQGPFHNFILPDGQSLLSNLHIVYMIGFALNFIVAVLIGCWLLQVCWWLVQRREFVTQRDSVPHAGASSVALIVTVALLIFVWLLAGSNTFGVVNMGERFLVIALMLLLLQIRMPRWLVGSLTTLCVVVGTLTLVSLLALSKSSGNYAVARSANSTELSSFVDDIYSNSRHNYFNHRLFIYANLGQYLLQPEAFERPLPVDHETSILQMRSD